MGLNTKKTMFKLISMLFLCFLHLNAASGQAKFATEPQDTEVLAGEEGKLQCIIIGEGTNCFWSRNDGEIEVNGRYSYTGASSNGDCSLRITNSNYERDDGLWACGLKQTSEASGMKSRAAKYTVLTAPNEPVIKVNDQPISNGADIGIPTDDTTAFKVECWSEGGNPAATLKWTLASQHLDLEGNTTIIFSSDNRTQTAILTLTSPVPSDGSWQNEMLACVASHGAYSEIPHKVYGYLRSPQVTGIATLLGESGTNVIQVPPNKQITLFCTADGFPVPELKWKTKTTESGDWTDYNSQVIVAHSDNITFPAFNALFRCDASNDAWASTVSSNEMNISTDTSASAEIGTIIAIVVVCIVAVVVMAAGVFTCYKKKMCIFKVNEDPVPKGGNGKLPMDNGANEEQAEQQQNLMTTGNETNGNVTNETSPNQEKKMDEVIHYAQVDFNNQSKPNPFPEINKTEYATIKVNGH